ncbi:hypothetical protein ACQEVH_16945 [Streptomyces lavendofoliae]
MGKADRRHPHSGLLPKPPQTTQMPQTTQTTQTTWNPEENEL